MELYYCAGGGRQFAQIAIESGLLYGARLPGCVQFPIQFADQDWKKPNKGAYMKALERYRPTLATVLDWEQSEQQREVFDWAESASAFVDTLIIIPKWYGAVVRIPEAINGTPIRIGVPCGPHQSTGALPLEIGNRPVHLLGGQPHRQMDLARYLNVVSVDCSTTAYMARLKCAFWENRRWIQLQSIGMGTVSGAPYEAFKRSCSNVIDAWNKFQ